MKNTVKRYLVGDSMGLTNLKIKQATAQDKAYKLSDDKGLYLYITPKAQKYWRMDYRFGGKRKTLALGVYPETTLADARSKCEEARKLIKNDIDPADVKRAKKIAKTQSQENSFKALALEWFAIKTPHWSSDHIYRVDSILNKELFPHVGNRSVGEITASDLLACLRRVESRGAIETAHRVKQVAGQVFRYAVASGKAERDPSADLKDALATPIKSHFAAITEPKEVGKLLIALDDYQGTPEVATALILAPLLFCRPNELRRMEWEEINFDKQEWHLPASKMKTKADHIVPLCKQAIEALQSLLQLTGHRQYVFPRASALRDL
jgi:integrase